MSLSQIVFLNFVLIVVGMSIAAYYWDKKKRRRWAPILATAIGGLVYLSFGPTPLTTIFAAKVLSTSLVLGFLFYFVVWIECRERRRKPTHH